MATSRKTQAKAGMPEKRRGQQMGDERSKPSKTEEAQAQSDNSPSVAAAVPTNIKTGESGGETEFKARQKTARKTRK